MVLLVSIHGLMVWRISASQGCVLGPLFFSLYLLYCRRALISLIFIHGYADDLQIHSHYLAPKISQLTKWHTHSIHVASHFILSNLAGVWSRGTFDPIFINGETISNTVRDLGVYINSSINLADYVPRLTTRTCFFKFVNLDLSIRCSLSNFRTPCAMVMTSLDYCNGLLGGKPCEMSHQFVIWRIRKGTVPHCFDISAKFAFKICELAHPCLRGSAPPYLIPHASERHPWTHIRTSQIGCGGHVKISRPRSQLDPGNFAISSPSAWNFLQVDFRDPGFSLITLR